MNNEIVLLVNDSDEVYFNNNSQKLADLVGKDIKPTNIANLHDKFVKMENFKAISLEMCDKPLLLTPSPLYKNVYYPTHSFNTIYCEDLSKIMYDLACKMGAESYKTSFETKIKKKKKRFFSLKPKFLFNNPQAQGNGEMDIEFEIGEQINLKKNENFIEEGKEIQHYNKKDLQKHIDTEGIEIDALPLEFSVKVKQYLNGEPISGVFSKEEELSGVAENITRFTFKLLANITNNAGNLLVDKFSEFKDIENFQFTSKIAYEIKFTPKP